MQADEQDTLIWDSEMRRPRFISDRKLRPMGRAVFVLDDPLNVAKRHDDDQNRLA